MPEIAYVNGRFCPLDEATVHVEDRGFQFADSVYEVLRTYGGQPFAVDEHLARLFRSMAAIELEHQFTTTHLKSLVAEAIQRGGFAESVVYVQVTRGRAPRNRGIPTGVEPALVLTVRALKPLAPQLAANGVAVITVPDNRWARCDIKSVALLGNVLAYHMARKAGVHDAIFIEPDGTMTEATAGNVFIVSGGRLLTPPKGPKLLAGITREKLLEAARAAQIPGGEERLTKGDLLAAEEVFVTSTTTEAMPVVKVDGQVIGTGKPGPVTARVHEQFLRMVGVK